MSLMGVGRRGRTTVSDTYCMQGVLRLRKRVSHHQYNWAGVKDSGPTNGFDEKRYLPGGVKYEDITSP